MSGNAGFRLDVYLRERGTVPHAKAARIAEEVLAQVAQLAAQGKSRALSGISPSRILVSPNGKVVLMGPPDELPTAVSAPEYTAPEEIRGKEPDVRTAIYSFGCALFEMLTGRPPFTGDDTRAVLRAHLSAPVPDPLALRPEIPPPLASVVRSFLSKDPNNRPANAARAAGAIRSALGLGSSAPPPRAAPTSPAPLGKAPQKTSNTARPRAAAPATLLIAGRRRALAAQGTRSALPLPSRGWFFTWCGLAVGVLLSLILITHHVVKAQAPPPPRPALSPAQREEVRLRREQFQRALRDEERIANMEFDKLNRYVTYPVLSASVAALLDRFAHTPAASRMAEEISTLRPLIEEAASAKAGEAGPEPREEAAPEAPQEAVKPEAEPGGDEGEKGL